MEAPSSLHGRVLRAVTRRLVIEESRFLVRPIFDSRVGGAVQPRSGAVVGRGSATTDTFGSRVELVRGTAMLSWPGMSPERVSVERTRSHPAFERHVRELGGGIDGILGLSALGARRILIEPKRQTMRLGPPSP
jgi:hypothetical protein